VRETVKREADGRSDPYESCFSRDLLTPCFRERKPRELGSMQGSVHYTSRGLRIDWAPGTNQCLGLWLSRCATGCPM
jgi:hypothetical protein